MKRSLAAAAALLVLAAVILTTLSLRLDSTATPLPVTVKAARGDVTAAEGLRFHTAVKYGTRLRWDTEYDVGSNTWDTVHRMPGGSDNGRLYYYDRREDIYDSRDNNRRYITLMAQPEDAMIRHLVAGAKAAQESGELYGRDYTERIRMRDFYDTYPLYLTWDRNDMNQLLRDDLHTYYDDTLPAFDKLRIPVGETDWMEPTLYYYADNNMSLYGDTTLHAENRFTSFSVGLDEGFLTTVGFAADADPQPDWAPEGFGLWYVPLELNRYTATGGGGYSYEQPDMARLRLVYPLDIAAQRVVGLQLTRDRSEILLTTAENSQYVLRVLDAGDFRCKLTLVVEEDASPRHFTASMLTQSGTSYKLDYDDYVLPVYNNSTDDLLVACTGSHLTVLRPGGDGWLVDYDIELLWPELDEDDQIVWNSEYRPLEDGNYGYTYGYGDYSSLGLISQLDEISMLYRDGRLALATGDHTGTYTLVSVYDRTGLLYGTVIDTGLAEQSMYTGYWSFFDPLYCTELAWD